MKKKIKKFTMTVLAIVVIKTFVLQTFFIPSGSMKPSLLIGDFVLVNKTKYGITIPILNKKILKENPKNGDIIVFSINNIMFSKRIVGIPGDTVYYTTDDIIKINNSKIYKEYLGKSIDIHRNGKIKIVNIYNESNQITYQTQKKSINNTNLKIKKIKLKEDEFFVLGDNRTNSLDSRVLGPIKERDIKGKITRILLSLDNLNIRKNRIFKKI